MCIPHTNPKQQCCRCVRTQRNNTKSKSLGLVLGLGKLAAMQRRKHTRARWCSKTKQRPKEQGRGRGHKGDGISGRWPEVEQSEKAQLLYLHMMSCNTDSDATEVLAATQHWAAGAYTKLGTKDATHRRSRSAGWCGKRESEPDRQCMQGIGVAQDIEQYN